ncbi:MAG: hypothetical protein C0412_14110, partial [Flavobacterium sp.]|nr:hypothetical protein [Flavobacterium sp.]
MVSHKKHIFVVFVCTMLFFSPAVAGAVICDPNLEGKSEQELLAIEAQCNVEIADLDSKIN